MKIYSEEKDTEELANVGDILEYYWRTLKYYREAKKRADIGIALALLGIGFAIVSNLF